MPSCLRRPVVGAGVEPFAGLEQILQRRQVVLAEVLAVGVFLLDRADRGRRGEHRLHPVLGRHPPERARIRRADRLALVEHGRRAEQQRAVDDVGVADDPADIGGGPIHVAGLRCRRCGACVHSSATACPPLSRTMPLGLPVVPEV